jgi:hypothetical protein
MSDSNKKKKASLDIVLANTYASEANKVAHSGYLTRAGKIRESNRIAELLVAGAAKRKIKIQYDIAYDGHPHELSFTECFGGMGGVYIRPADSNLSRQMLASPFRATRDINFLLNAEDKYAQLPIHCPVDHVIFLPGTNLLDRYKAEVFRPYYREGVKVKPHPITSEYFRFLLLREFGSDVLPLKGSAQSILKQVKEVTVTQHTEMGLYALLQGKKVNVIPAMKGLLPVYRYFYETGERLKEVLSSHLSGLFFMNDNIEEQIEEWFDYYQSQSQLRQTRFFDVFGGKR